MTPSVAHSRAGVQRPAGTASEDASRRTIAIPAPLIGRLGDRRIKQFVDNPLDLVFPTVTGKLRDPRNTHRDWSNARTRLGLETVTSHSFRKTVATVLDQEGESARAIAEVLGHANPSIAQNTYMAKNTGGKKAAEALASHVA
ncbi:tyrosine-type recombinase/integrase [Leifsonia sp. NPDC058248]|uniref:tyrosine-type recombinase/integrase n=1 Tax=Leifsonia sp. NPDC058248 TaxID=3346402 RepID=UPI0036DA06D5